MKWESNGIASENEANIICQAMNNYEAISPSGFKFSIRPMGGGKSYWLVQGVIPDEKKSIVDVYYLGACYVLKLISEAV